MCVVVSPIVDSAETEFGLEPNFPKYGFVLCVLAIRARIEIR